MILFIVVSISLIAQAASDRVLFDAVRENDPKQIEKSLNEGSDINEIGPGGQTPLMFAVLNGKLESVKYLLSKGADTAIGEEQGYTPLHGAGFQGRAQIAKELIEYGLNPRDKHSDGYEPIHRASWGREQRHLETVKVLIQYGVPYDAMSDSEQTPFDMAKPNTPVHKYLNDIHRENRVEL